ncbi:hypothetical protein EXIGLDRAFT_783879 [Exidia glandulosa HHB12029]|uniref:SWIM-type domain-containing protein n=1 Tax=Exidia glandulosa HHB12029 TaxID=1314781 RepID=A0A166MU83_EXIGL|nr:hypothetical protein EXIGLDRAFT_783879 [Exidia glandulosa HHB12029]
MVRLGFDGKAIRAMLRMSTEELAQISETAQSIPSSMRISGQDVYNALRRRLDAETFLAPEMSESLKLWIHQLSEANWSTIFESLPIPGEPAALCLGLVSPWQREMIKKYGDTVCLDSTHNTCVTEDGGKIFLYTLVARDRTTGKGTPLAFMVTDRETHHPLVRFLRWMHEATGFSPRSILIDCSDTEALAIKLAFDDTDVIPVILYCYWHLLNLFRAWEKNVKSKVKLGRMASKEDTAETLRDAMKSLYGLMEAASEAEFDARVDEFTAEWGDQKAFVLYVQTEWLTCKERWVKAWRAHAHYAIDTNNFIESWHSNLKRNYLKLMRRRRLDFIIRVLTQEVVPDFMRAHVRRADELLLEDAEGRVHESGNDMILVDSFTQDDVSYHVQVADSAISACSCPYHASTSLPCKHMFLAQRVTTYSIRRDKATLPAAAQPAPPFDVHTHAAEKRAMCARIAAEITKLSSTSAFARLAQGNDTALLPFSRTDLATLLSSLESARRSAHVLLAGTAPHAPQTY